MDNKYLAEMFDQAKSATVFDEDAQGLHELRWLGYDKSELARRLAMSLDRTAEGVEDA